MLPQIYKKVGKWGWGNPQSTFSTFQGPFIKCSKSKPNLILLKGQRAEYGLWFLIERGEAQMSTFPISSKTV